MVEEGLIEYIAERTAEYIAAQLALRGHTSYDAGAISLIVSSAVLRLGGDPDHTEFFEAFRHNVAAMTFTPAPVVADD